MRNISNLEYTDPRKSLRLNPSSTIVALSLMHASSHAQHGLARFLFLKKKVQKNRAFGLQQLRQATTWYEIAHMTNLTKYYIFSKNLVQK